mmetsp:Transcript_36870/g.59110  ORF Transcript_36870/g.59110 Transcript_36870/m.59110 type:complete len:213 (+) Transcript_36870:77-715(+)
MPRFHGVLSSIVGHGNDTSSVSNETCDAEISLRVLGRASHSSAQHSAFLGTDVDHAVIRAADCKDCNFTRLARLIERARIRAGEKGLRNIEIEGVDWKPPGTDVLSKVLQATSDTLEELHLRGINANLSAANPNDAAALGGALKDLRKLRQIEVSLQSGPLCQAGAWIVEAGLPSSSSSWSRQSSGLGFVWTREPLEIEGRPNEMISGATTS